MEQESQTSQRISGSGNTKITTRARAWAFTLCNPTTYNIISHTQLINLWSGLKCVGYVIQLEKGENGTEHYQGCVRFENQICFKTLHAMLNAIHWEAAKDWKKLIHYCCKIETRIDGPWIHNVEVFPEEEIHIISELRPWQKEIENNILSNNWDDRKINWYWEPNGNTGKTALAKYICVKYKHLNPIYLCGKAADIKCAVAKMISMKRIPKICIFGFVRSMEQFISYQAIEEVKDGLFFSGKYESAQCNFNSPMIYCFSNFEPIIGALSPDRWNLVRITN